ncbi:hypothetical protein WJX75_002208 [Coccomyxa subellipsoidea]|uniref:Glucose-methanol-choline oxidoreductase N-terminal domain-containing protein n=1 Tax=Coccomyxa subellipsoidea TaxID=248742 RepID=A0ABR2YAG3_9CHLO
MLEAGGVNEAKEVRTPVGLPKLFKSALDWNLYSTPQHAANKRSAENNCRGIEDGVHGTGGLMRVENPRYNNPLHDVFFRAAKQAGIPENDNFNDWRRSQVGYGEFQVTQSRVAVSRGVTFQLNCQDGNKHSAELAPGGEVVLCAGSIHSPQILQLSGIGPQGQLREKGIPVVVDLPGVGKNMQGADLSTLRSGIKLARHIAAQPACAAFVASELHPGAPASSDAAIDEFIRDTVHSGNANVGTCSMAAAPGGNAVVDPCLRVFGVRGLRVADASVIPVIPGGQTGAATVMVAERAAQILLGSAVQQLSAPVPAARLTLA